MNELLAAEPERTRLFDDRGVTNPVVPVVEPVKNVEDQSHQ